MLATIGLILFSRTNRTVGGSALCVLAVFYYFMASYPDWPGISSYGNRFFVSLTVFFVLGLAVVLGEIAARIQNLKVARAGLAVVLSVFVVWNLGLIFQWGAHLIPTRGPISWSEVVRNQFSAVPRQCVSQLQSYLFRRKDALDQIEQRDLDDLRRRPEP
jgi:hypothetical protein